MSEFEFPKKSVFVCNGSKCGKHKEIRKYFKEAVKEHSLKKEVEIFKLECTGRCKSAPIVFNATENQWVQKTTVSKAEKIIKNILAQKKLL